MSIASKKNDDGATNRSILTRARFLALTFQREDRFTASTNMYISHNYPQLNKLYFHIPNESATSDLMRLKLYAMGVLPGVPDFCFMEPYVWYLELKLPGKSLSTSQIQLHKIWGGRRIVIHTAWTPKEVCKLLEEIFGAPRYPN